MDILTAANPVVQAIVGGATFGAVFYLRVRWPQDGEDITEFDPYNFGTTVGLSAVLGAGLWAIGMVPTFESVGWLLAAFAGAVALTEAGIKALVRGERYAAQRYFTEAGEEAFRSLLGLGTTEEQVRESVERGAREAGEQTPEEQREAWDGALPDDLTAAQVDDDAGDVDEQSDGERDSDQSNEPMRDLPPA